MGSVPHGVQGPAPSGAAPAGSWYDPTSLLVSLRPAARVDLAATAGVAHIEDLPLYDLDIVLDHSAATFTLHEEIWFTNTDNVPVNEVVFRLYANVTGDAAQPGHPPRVSLVRGACVGAACSVTSEGPSVIVVHPTAPVVPGGRLRVSMELTGSLQRIASSRTNVLMQSLEGLTQLASGEGLGNYGLLAIGDSIASMANFYPVLARRRNHAWERNDASAIGDLGSDELAHVRARIDAPTNVRVVTTGVQTSESGGGAAPRRRVEVAAAMVRDFALLASPDFQTESRRVGDVELRATFLASERAAGLRTLDTAEHALQTFERRFGFYPYADLDVVEAALVGGAGGVEFAGLVTVASMLYRPMLPTSGPLGEILTVLGVAGGALGRHAALDNLLEFVTAHEVAHQWWHGIVGNDSRQHPFVDEGLAQWSAALYLEERYGATRARQDADANVRMNYQVMRLLGHPDAPVDRPVSAFGSPLSYAGLVYGKGPYMYNALRTAVGDGPFFAALQGYVARYRFRLAPSRGFVDMLAASAGPMNGPRIQALARHWLDETHGDEDLGRIDIASVVTSVLGPGAARMGPQIQQVLQLLGVGGERGQAAPDLGPLMQRLQQVLGGGAAGAPGDPGNDIEQMMRDLQGMMAGRGR